MIERVGNKLRQEFKKWHQAFLVQGKMKYFCIGGNKTGTTSLEKAFLDLGHIVGDQRIAEVLVNQYCFGVNFTLQSEIVKL